MERAALSVDEMSGILDCSAQYVRSLIRKGKIPAVQVGKTWIIDSAVLEKKQLMFDIVRDVPDQVRKSAEIPEIVALSFFSGAMGLDCGLEKAGIHPLLASEIEPNTRKTILLNRPDIGLIGDINSYNAADIRKFAGISEDQEIDLIIGGPPCQAFSTAGQRKGFDDARGNVFLTFIDRILELRPKYAVIENVRGILSAPFESEETVKSFGFAPQTPEDKKGGALLHIIDKLEKGGYTVTFNLYNAANYGAPQIRERVVFFCSRDGERVPYLNPTHDEQGRFNLPKWKVLNDAIGDLKEDDQEFAVFPERRLRYYRMLKAGQNWRCLPEALQKEALGGAYNTGGGKVGFLRRLDWNKPSPTLVTDPTMPATDLCHPDRDRPVSVQEYKRIQEFPDDWKLFGSLKDKYRQLGNAVPISLGYAIGKQIVRLINRENIATPPENFPFSRYANTNETTFKMLIERKRRKHQAAERPEKQAA